MQWSVVNYRSLRTEIGRCWKRLRLFISHDQTNHEHTSHEHRNQKDQGKGPRSWENLLRKQPQERAIADTSIAEWVSTDLYIRPTQTSTVISWERPVTAPPTLFALYRASTAQWSSARLIEQPIFCTTSLQRMAIEYHCIDPLPHLTEETSYWLVAQQDENVHCQGPFLLQTYSIGSFSLNFG